MAPRNQLWNLRIIFLVIRDFVGHEKERHAAFDHLEARVKLFCFFESRKPTLSAAMQIEHA